VDTDVSDGTLRCHRIPGGGIRDQPVRKPDSTWVWKLTDAGDGTTRLVTRVRVVYTWSHPLTALLGVVLMEFGDFAMMRRMLLGIRETTEALVGGLDPQPLPGRAPREPSRLDSLEATDRCLRSDAPTASGMCDQVRLEGIGPL
jgi:hypothetical protein